jgi:hypothetical protein
MIVRDKNDSEIAMIVSRCERAGVGTETWNYVLLRSVTPSRPIGQIGTIVDCNINSSVLTMWWETFVPKR